MARGPRLGVPELTGRGWALTAAAGGLLAAGFVFGADALVALAVGAAVAIGAAAVFVLRRRFLLALDRSVRPGRLAVGRDGRIVLHGVAARGTPALSLTESVDGGERAARFVVVPLAAGTAIEAGYRVPTERRGRHEVGPALLTVADPCGLVRRSWQVADTAEVVVWPRVHDVLPPRRGGGGEPAERASGPRVPVVEALGEFLALREYEPGDDPRRVHWRSTARRGELLVRVDDAPAPGRPVVLFDVRPASYGRGGEQPFEVAVEAVASIASSLQRTHQPAEVLTSAGENMRRPGANALEAVLDRLAVIAPDGTDHLAAVTRALRNRLGVGAVVVVTGTLDQALLDVAAALRGRRTVTVVTTRPARVPTGALSVVDASQQPFATAWNTVMQAPLRWHPANSRSRSHSPR